MDQSGTSIAASGDSPGGQASPPTFAQSLDELETAIEDACTSCRETKEKSLGGKSALQPANRGHTGDPSFIPPVPSSLARVRAMIDRVKALAAEMGEVARSF